MSYNDLEICIIRLDMIMLKKVLNDNDIEFLKALIKELKKVDHTFFQASLSQDFGHHRKLNERHFDYLLNLPMIPESDKRTVRAIFSDIIINNYKYINFFNVSFENFDFENIIVPALYLNDDNIRKNLLEFLRRTNKSCFINWRNIKDINELFGLNVIVFAGVLGFISLKDFAYIREIAMNIIGSNQINFDSNITFEILKQYYFETRDPNFGIHVQKVFNGPYNLQNVKSGEFITFNYSVDEVMKAIEISRELSKTGKKDVKFVFLFPSVGKYIDMPYSKRKEITDALRQLKYRNTIIQFENRIEAGRMSLTNYIRCVNYYDRIAEKARMMDLSPFEQYLYAFNITKTFKKYGYFGKKENDIIYQNISRNPFLILKNDSIVCTGYILFMREILDRLGINNLDYILPLKEEEDIALFDSHERLLVSIYDQKYEIYQPIISDPTWNSLSNTEIRGFDMPYPQFLRNTITYMRKLTEHRYTTAVIPPQGKYEKYNTCLPIPMSKLFSAIINLKRKEGRLSQNELNRYQSRVLKNFLYTEEGISYLKYYCDTASIDEIVNFLKMLSFTDILLILKEMQKIMLVEKYNSLFDNYQIREIYLANLKSLTLNDLNNLPIDFSHYLANKMLELKNGSASRRI